MVKLRSEGASNAGPIAHRLLRRGRVYPVPAAVQAALEHVLEASVRSVKVVEHSTYARAHRGLTATTRRDLILLSISGDEFLSDPELVLHEYFHVVRQWNIGVLTRRRYLVEALRHGYRDNRFELEARGFAALTGERYQKILAGRQ